jgi:hypothetical protein
MASNTAKYAAQVKSANGALRVLRSTHGRLLAELKSQRGQRDSSEHLARACDDVKRAIDAISFDRGRILDLITEIEEWDASHPKKSAG